MLTVQSMNQQQQQQQQQQQTENISMVYSGSDIEAESGALVPNLMAAQEENYSKPLVSYMHQKGVTLNSLYPEDNFANNITVNKFSLGLNNKNFIPTQRIVWTISDNQLHAHLASIGPSLDRIVSSMAKSKCKKYYVTDTIGNFISNDASIAEHKDYKSFLQQIMLVNQEYTELNKLELTPWLINNISQPSDSALQITNMNEQNSYGLLKDRVKNRAQAKMSQLGIETEIEKSGAVTFLASYAGKQPSKQPLKSEISSNKDQSSQSSDKKKPADTKSDPTIP